MRFRTSMKSLMSGEEQVHEHSTARAMRADTPEGWLPLVNLFLGDVNITEMRVVSANLMQTFTLSRQPGACDEEARKPQVDVNVHEGPSGTWIIHTDEVVDGQARAPESRR